MPCGSRDHEHPPWPQEGTHRFAIEACETHCGWCAYQTKNANNLRVHARRHITNENETSLRGITIVKGKAGRKRVQMARRRFPGSQARDGNLDGLISGDFGDEPAKADEAKGDGKMDYEVNEADFQSQPKLVHLTAMPTWRMHDPPASDTESLRSNYEAETGCATCIRRMKRCDLNRPECRNCFQGGFVCLGYQKPSQSPRKNHHQIIIDLTEDPDDGKSQEGQEPSHQDAQVSTMNRVNTREINTPNRSDEQLEERQRPKERNTNNTMPKVNKNGFNPGDQVWLEPRDPNFQSSKQGFTITPTRRSQARAAQGLGSKVTFQSIDPRKRWRLIEDDPDTNKRLSPTASQFFSQKSSTAEPHVTSIQQTQIKLLDCRLQEDAQQIDNNRLRAIGQDEFLCDYHFCTGAGERFTRKEQYRDHLRDFHREDIGCTGEKMLAERKVHFWQWRCSQCLIENVVSEDGWTCRSCNADCEQDRIRAREKIWSKEAKGLLTADDGPVSTYRPEAASTQAAQEHGASSKNPSSRSGPQILQQYPPVPLSRCGASDILNAAWEFSSILTPTVSESSTTGHRSEPSRINSEASESMGRDGTTPVANSAGQDKQIGQEKRESLLEESNEEEYRETLHRGLNSVLRGFEIW